MAVKLTRRNLPAEFWLLLVLMLTLTAGAAQAQAPEDKLKNSGFSKTETAAVYLNDEVLVKFKPALAPEELKAFNRQTAAVATGLETAKAAFHKRFRTRTFGRTVLGWQRLRLPAGQAVNDALAQLRANPLVENIEPNYQVKAVAAAMSTTYTPNGAFDDPFYTDGKTQWWINRTKGDAAKNAGLVFQGTGDIVVAVVDTGV
ncbi:MAG: hypothetical protein HGA76_05445, partial [Candidatus Firestonebacteria bacterium]|nr:hypothetical protein [Candidatus Firestonebacteria bacterium]